LLIILVKPVVILFIAFNYTLYPQNTKNSHFHQIIHPISPNHTLIPIGSVTFGIRAQRSQPGSNSHPYLRQGSSAKFEADLILTDPVFAAAVTLHTPVTLAAATLHTPVTRAAGKPRARPRIGAVCTWTCIRATGDSPFSLLCSVN
jgi:hypothetical protein